MRTLKTNRLVPVVVFVSALSVHLAGVPALAETLILDTDYIGSAHLFGGFPPAYVFYQASGTGLFAPAGLDSVSLGAEGSFDWFGRTDRFVIDDLPEIFIRTPQHGGVRGYLRNGTGTVDDFAGDWIVDQGDGQFVGSTGSGSFHIRTASRLFTSPRLQVPATISIRGSLYRPIAPIPEPGTLLLLAVGLASAPLLKSRFRLR